MSDYCELQILTPDCQPPKDLYTGFDITYIEQNMNDNLMFDVIIHELNLGEIIGSLRASERNVPCKIYIKYGVYHGTLIENKWLEEIDYLPRLKPWQSYAIYLGKGSMIQYQIEHMDKLRKSNV